MSRIGKKPIEVPENVQVKCEDGLISVKGPLGELSEILPEKIEFNMEGNIITFSRENEMKPVKSLHGLVRSLTANMVEGVSKGFEKTLKIEGVGFKAELKGERLLLSLGFSHPILVIAPDGVSFEVPNANTVKIKGASKQIVGQIAAKIRKQRPPEPYKGKGVRYEGEYVRRKAGKTAA